MAGIFLNEEATVEFWICAGICCGHFDWLVVWWGCPEWWVWLCTVVWWFSDTSPVKTWKQIYEPSYKRKDLSIILWAIKQACAAIKWGHMSHVMRKPVYPYVNYKDADQPAHPCSLISVFVIRCLDSIIPLDAISEISSLYLASLAEQAGLSLNWSQTPKTGFLNMWLIYTALYL